MVEANQSLQHAALRARLARAAIILAQREAEKAVKQALAAKGIKLQRIAKREIVTLASEYLAAHPELIAEAKPIIEQWRREVFFGKRAARVERNSRVLFNGESIVPQAFPLNEYRAQNWRGR